MEKIRELGNKERFSGSTSVALLLTHGRAGRLLLVRHGVVYEKKEKELRNFILY